MASAILSGKADAPTNSGAQLLALPRPGVPVTFEQIEERSDKAPERAAITTSSVTSKTYRDSFGRLRMDSESRDSHGRISASYIQLFDPVAGFRALLFSDKNIAYRFPFSPQGQANFSFGIAPNGEDSSHKWHVGTERAGRRVIGGSEFEGTRIVRSTEDDSALTTTVERWYSDDLKRIGAIESSGPRGTENVLIKGLQRGEPEPTLFVIPSGYKVLSPEGLK